MITVEDFYYKYKESNINISKIQFKNAMIEFAKLHVEAALKSAKEQANYPDINGNYDLILNVYPLSNIK